MRIERDAMGEVQIPDEAYWGASTQRAVANFPVSGQRFDRGFLQALALVKRSCAEANMALGLLSEDLGRAVVNVCEEMAEGRLDDHFPIDVFQTGSGTSTNMNANEVIANRAIEVLGGVVGSQTPVHPNDHVNLCQSSNDVIPTAIHVALALAVREELVPSLVELCEGLVAKGRELASVVKTGRTHLQDATPVTLGQVFGGYAARIGRSVARSRRMVDLLRQVPLGGTAVGTGVNRAKGFPERALTALNRETGCAFQQGADPMEANASRDAAVEASGLLRTTAVAVHRVADDLRWLASGPRAGLGELQLPPVQPGSSIMPGKVNPVICESTMMAASQVLAHDHAVVSAGLGGNFELNTSLPLLAHNLLGAVGLLAAASRNLLDRCIHGLTADEEGCLRGVERNLALVTALVPVVGYDRAAELAGLAASSGQTIREVALREGVLHVEELDRLLNPLSMTKPGLGRSAD